MKQEEATARKDLELPELEPGELLMMEERTETKPGWKTSELAVTIVVILTALMAGVGALGLGTDHWAVKACAFLAAALAAMGYGVARAVVKTK